jgi:protein-tyrosine-phosphatase
MNPQKPFQVLFLCTGNTARSILAEYLLRRFGEGRFESLSAGASPKGEVNPYALRVLKEVYGLAANEARSKSWQEFRDAKLDFVITLCDSARETCPTFPGRPITAHWGSPDPAAFVGDDQATFDFFAKVALQIKWRIELFCSLQFAELDRLRLEQATREIGEANQPATR